MGSASAREPLAAQRQVSLRAALPMLAVLGGVQPKVRQVFLMEF